MSSHRRQRSVVEPPGLLGLLGLLVLLALLVTLPAAALEIPYLAGRINDLATILSPEAKQRIEGRLAALEESAGSQMAILTVPSLEGESLEDYSVRVAETWALGRADADDGVLLLIARDDRKMRLEIGYGLEGILTDAYSRRILDEVIQPRFRTGDFDGGIERAVETIAALIEGNDILPPVEAASRRPATSRYQGALIAFVLMLLPFIASAITTPGCAGWLLYFFLMPFWYGLPRVTAGQELALICLAGWVIAFPILRRILPSRAAGSRWLIRGPLAGGWSSSRDWGGRSSGGGFSGGGFSGGGGSFGGGGSSSGW